MSDFTQYNIVLYITRVKSILDNIYETYINKNKIIKTVTLLTKIGNHKTEI